MCPHLAWKTSGARDPGQPTTAIQAHRHTLNETFIHVHRLLIKVEVITRRDICILSRSLFPGICQNPNCAQSNSSEVAFAQLVISDSEVHRNIARNHCSQPNCDTSPNSEREGWEHHGR